MNLSFGVPVRRSISRASLRDGLTLPLSTAFRCCGEMLSIFAKLLCDCMGYNIKNNSLFVKIEIENFYL